jgi:hypothetical protein
VVQHQTSEANVTQEEVHLGAQTWSLNQGLMFDNVTLSLQLLSSTSVSVADEYAPTVLSAAGADIFTDFPDIIFGQPQPSLFFHGGPGNGQIIYVSAVPLPAGIALYLPLLVLGGMKVLRRRA